MTIRTFVCVELPAAERDRLGALQGRLREHGARVSWPAPATIHVTLAFLGDVDEPRVPVAVAAVGRAAAAAAPFRLHVEGVGAFPSLGRPRVIWAGLAGEARALAALQSRVAAELEGAGFGREERAFRPHATIGRVKDAADRALRELRAAIACERLVGEPFDVGEVVVMRSELDASGARHTPLARLPLAGVADPRYSP